MDDQSAQVEIGEGWLSGLEPEMSIVEAAHLVLERRFAGVERMIDRVRGEEPVAERAVHKLRVSTRRAGAGLALFGDHLSKERSRRVRRVLKRVRRAAGGARECDVFARQFSARMDGDDPQQVRAAAYLVGWLSSERRVAAALLRAELGADERSLRKRCTALLESMESAGSERAPSLGMVARAALVPLVDAVRRSEGDDLTEMIHVHELRIALKRLRYAVEVLQSCAVDRTGMEACYERIAALQDRLGLMNDLAEQLRLLEDRFLRPDVPGHPGLTAVLVGSLERLRDAVASELLASHESFLGWWREGAGRAVTGELLEYFGYPDPAAPGTMRDGRRLPGGDPARAIQP